MKLAVIIFTGLALFGLMATEPGTAFAGENKAKPAEETSAGMDAQGGESADARRARAQTLYFSGMNALNHNLAAKAVEDFKESLEFNPGHYNTHLMMCKAYAKLEKYDEAQDILRKAMEIEPAKPAAYDLSMQLYLYREQPEKSLETAEAALKAGIDAQSLPDLGWTYYLVGKLDDALRFFNNSMERYGETYGTVRNLGILSFVREDYVEALKYFKKAGELDPDNFAVHYLKAVTFNRLDDKPSVAEQVRAMKKITRKYKAEIARYEKNYFPNTDPGSLKNYIYMLKEGAPGTDEYEE